MIVIPATTPAVRMIDEYQTYPRATSPAVSTALRSGAANGAALHRTPAASPSNSSTPQAIMIAIGVPVPILGRARRHAAATLWPEPQARSSGAHNARSGVLLRPQNGSYGTSAVCVVSLRSLD